MVTHTYREAGAWGDSRIKTGVQNNPTKSITVLAAGEMTNAIHSAKKLRSAHATSSKPALIAITTTQNIVTAVFAAHAPLFAAGLIVEGDVMGGVAYGFSI